MSIAKKIKIIQDEIKNTNVKLIAVTKTVDIDKAEEAINTGCMDIGENRVQEFNRKYEVLKDKTNFHLIGHLQTNKVKYIVGKAKLIHSVDSLKLINEIERVCKNKSIVQDILLQVNISHEESKFGLDKNEVLEILNLNENNEHVKIKGLMTMAPFTANAEETRIVFKGLKDLSNSINKNKYKNTKMEDLSMGMSNDYKIAIEEGATLIRVGSKIFK